VIRIFALLALAAVTTVAQAPAPPARANLWIDVVVLDGRDLTVTDLAPAEFEVWISGYRVPITDVRAVTPESSHRRVAAVVLDNVAVPPDLVPRVREAARALARQVRPGDAVSIIPLHGGAMAATDDRAALMRAIDGYSVRGFPFRIEDAGEHVLRTVTALSRQFAEVSDGRKTIVAIGAGWMFDTPLPPLAIRDLGREWIEAIRELASTHTALYVIDPAGIAAGPGRLFGGDSGFARETGGHAFMHTNDLRGAAERIWREAGAYYMLGVADPPVQKTADLREVSVKVLRKGVTIRARKAVKGRP
jgi:VWFA-related protein